MRLRIVNRARYGKTTVEEGITLPSKVRTIDIVYEKKSCTTRRFEKL